MFTLRSFSVSLLTFALFLTLNDRCPAQPPVNPADKTLLEIELLVPALGGNPLLAQNWRKVFEELGEGVRIRQPISSDRIKIEELPRGPFRLVRIVGEISRDGVLRVPGKSFKSTQTAELKEFLDELKTYGALGAPSGKPLWGLTRGQLDSVEAALKAPVTDHIKGKTWTQAMQAVPLDDSLPLVFHSSAEALRQQGQNDPVPEEVQGLSAGTVLAYLLSQRGLGFRPLRTPQGSLQLMVHPLADAPDAWPIGKEMNDDHPRDQYVPGLFKQLETGVNPSPLSMVLDVIETQAGVRILIDRRACLKKRLDPDQLPVSYPRRKTAWALIISSIVVNSHMTMNYRQDEAGTGFILITPFEHYQPPMPRAVDLPAR